MPTEEPDIWEESVNDGEEGGRVTTIRRRTTSTGRRMILGKRASERGRRR